MFIKNNKKLNKNEMEDTVVEIVKSAKAESQFSVFQIVIFAFLFVVMIWIIGFLTVEMREQRAQLILLNKRLSQVETGGVDLLKNYIDKIRDLQKIDIQEQVQKFGDDIKDNIKKVRELMFDKVDLLRLETRMKNLEDYNSKFRGLNLIKFTSFMVLRDAVNRGSSFRKEFDIFKEIMGENKDLEALSKTLDRVKDIGIKNSVWFRDEFKKISGDIVFASKNKNPDSIRDKVLNRLMSIFKIRKVSFEKSVEDKNIENVEYLVKYIGDRLDIFDLRGAKGYLLDLQRISPTAFSVALDFTNSLDYRLAFDEAMSNLFGDIVNSALVDIKFNKL